METKTKTFKYLGFTFEPVRQFTRSEAAQGISISTYSIGVSNYPNMRNARSSQWSHSEFYKKAAKVGAGEIDIFLMNGKALVIPCENELFAYGKEEAEKLPKVSAPQPQPTNEVLTEENYKKLPEFLKPTVSRTQGEWVVGYSSPESSENCCLAIWEKSVLESGFGSVICKLSPEVTMSEVDKANAAYICKAVNNFDSLLENLSRIIDRIEESNLQDQFPSAYKRAKEAIHNATK